jgi:phosphatidylserine/phosphatidylglycerophosphate/cardiolipin synthase-like enzyme
VQVLRTYPAKRPVYPFAPDGERSVARAYLKALGRARRLVYLEDQYFWSERAAHALADALRANPELHVVVVVPRFPDRDGRVAGPAARIGRERAMRIVERAGGDRVLVCDVENIEGTPIYVHAKVCIVDDVWMMVGSDNMNRRSWTHDSELSCAVLDASRATLPGSVTAPGRSRVTPGSSSGASTWAAPRAPATTTCSSPTARSGSSGAPRRRSTAGTTAAGTGSGRPVTCACIDPNRSRPVTVGGRVRSPAS